MHNQRSIYPIFSLKNPILWILLPLALYIAIRVPPLVNDQWVEVDPLFRFPTQHFYIVSITSLISLGLSIAVGLVGGRQRNLQVIYVSLAFISLAGFFSMHGLATPGFILEPNAIVSVAAELSVLTMSFWLLVSSLPARNLINAYLERFAGRLVAGYTTLIAAMGIALFAFPSLAEFIPVSSEPLKYFAAVVTISLAWRAGLHYWQSYRYSRFSFQLALVYTCGWIVVSQIIITTGVTFYGSWWIYHFLLLFSVVALVLGLSIQYRRGDSLLSSILGLFSEDPRQRLEAGISPAVRDLVKLTEERDPYTAGHSYRVASNALELGSALKLPPEDLRVLVQGGIVHDIGKLQVSDDVLNKPGELTYTERKQVEKHPEYGFEMCERLGFMAGELSIIRSHHENLDGSGYPDGLAGEAIPRLARLMHVADVWDALTSARAYRPAWQRAKALTYLKENRGSLFDPLMVDAWLDVLQAKNE